MKFYLTVFPSLILLLMSGYSAGIKGRSPYQPYVPDAIYEDIKRLNATCSGMDSCEIPRTDDPWKYNCNCDDSCSYFGTCCIDSKYRHKYRQKYIKNLECRQLNNKRNFLYPLVRSCNPSMRYDKATEELCLSRGIPLSDPLLEIPVTDPVTGITYSNYFCYACNEKYGAERLIPWNVAVGIGDLGHTLEEINKTSEIPNLNNYKDDFWAWVTDNDNGTSYSIWPAIPEELEDVLPFCFGFEIVSECAPDWTDENVRKLCQSYMALTRIFNGTSDSFIGIRYSYTYYRNPHCAICNYENLDNMVCVAVSEYPITAEGGLLPSGDFFVRLFSLHDKSVECGNRMVYDRFSKKCRNIYRPKKLAQ